MRRQHDTLCGISEHYDGKPFHFLISAGSPMAVDAERVASHPCAATWLAKYSRDGKRRLIENAPPKNKNSLFAQLPCNDKNEMFCIPDCEQFIEALPTDGPGTCTMGEFTHIAMQNCPIKTDSGETLLKCEPRQDDFAVLCCGGNTFISTPLCEYWLGSFKIQCPPECAGSVYYE